MIRKLSLKSFKCFPELTILFAPVTLLTGLNSSGKSTVLQAIRICKAQEIPRGLGTEIDLKCKNTNNYPEISIELVGGYEEQCNFSEFGIVECEPSGVLEHVNYISADRFGSRVCLPYKENVTHVGEFGENVYTVLDMYRSQGGVPETLRHQSIQGISSIFEQVRAWLSIISPGVKFDFQIYANADIGAGVFTEFRPTNVGFGLSYALPIIVSVIVNAARIASSNIVNFVTLLLENPEAHLHPRGQTQLGYFLALASQCGVQTVIETHSEHILNGIRLAVKEKKVPDNDAIFHYFYKSSENEISEMKSIFTDENGMLDEWPDGFFDEAERILMRFA